MATRWNSKHTGQKIDDTIDYVTNPNLLDNWYFPNCVNQRGNTAYTGTGYTIDRWKSGSSSLKAEVTSDGLVLSSTSTSAVYFSQYLDGGIKIDDSYTISDMVAAVTGTAYCQAIYNDGTYGTAMKLTVGLNTLTVKTAKTISRVLFQINSGSSVTVNSAKLELGSQQTLAHQDADGKWVLNEIPDYGEQLARCQRYALALSKQSGHSVYGSGMINAGQNARIVVPLPVTMRTKPTVSVTGDLEIIANGTTYAVTSVSVETLSPSAVCLLVNSAYLSTTQAATPALLRSSGGGKGELFLSADL